MLGPPSAISESGHQCFRVPFHILNSSCHTVPSFKMAVAPFYVHCNHINVFKKVSDRLTKGLSGQHNFIYERATNCSHAAIIMISIMISHEACIK